MKQRSDREELVNCFCDECGNKVFVYKSIDKWYVVPCSVCEDEIYVDGQRMGYIEGRNDAGFDLED